MEDSTAIESASPFPPGYRASGLLLHIISLPSRYGIGDLGPGAFAWVDRLHESGQTWWQSLPFGPTGYCNSPYQCLSSFIGNTLMVSPELLIEDGLLTADDCRGEFSSNIVDYDAVIPFKDRLFEAAWARFRGGVRKDLTAEYEQFCVDRASWLNDYVLFRALKIRYNGAYWIEWPRELVERSPSALTEARRSLTGEIEQIRFSQFLLFRQALGLKAYAREKGVRLIGDLPFFVSPDSSDVWANPELFVLDEKRRPLFVGGVPPDYFSETGQMWGNPVYDWEAHRRTKYAWCIERFRSLLAHVDLIRLDHFRAFAAAWHIPRGASTAATGEWVPGPGAELFNAVKSKLGALPFIAEDLGVITPDVVQLRDEFNMPSTRVLQFAFDGGPDNPHLPENYSTNTVVYSGTHDKATAREWYEHLAGEQRQALWTYLDQPEGDVAEVAPEMIRLPWSSPAALAITPLQDMRNLGGEGRMNVPGQAEGNWRWRASDQMLSATNFDWLSELTDRTSRAVRVRSSAVEVTR